MKRKSTWWRVSNLGHYYIQAFEAEEFGEDLLVFDGTELLKSSSHGRFFKNRAHAVEHVRREICWRLSRVRAELSRLKRIEDEFNEKYGEEDA